jgi:hypothetical protein
MCLKSSLGLDFLSSSPNNFIFKETANKTTCGVICSLLYIIGLIAFSVYCFVKYYKQDRYFVEYSHYLNDLNHRISDLNKSISFKYVIYYQDDDGKWLLAPNNFFLFDYYTRKEIPRNVSLLKNIYNFGFFVVYICSDGKREIEEYFKNRKIAVELDFTTEGLIFQKEDPIVPLQFYERMEMTAYDSREFSREFIYYFEEIICTDKGFFGDKNKSIINIKYREQNLNPINKADPNKENGVYRIFGDVFFRIDIYNWSHYKRTEKSILETFSYICSIGLVGLNIVTKMIFLFYSRFFDNYKIVQHLLFGNDTLIRRNIEISKKLTNKKQEPLNINLSNSENVDENGIDYENKSQPEENVGQTDINFPEKLSCCSFVFNCFYCEYCKKYKKKNQILISKCGDIISEYYSVEKIIYNQLLMENLIEDYKWNNIKLKNIRENKSIISLINSIKGNYPADNT